MRLSKLYIDRPVAHLPEVASIRSCLNIPSEIIDGPHTVFQRVNAATDPVQFGKEVLFLTQNKGAFIKACPGTRNYRCCDYKILHIGTYCTMDCAYCILQTYFHPPVLQYFVNKSDLWAELERLFAEKSLSRIGTGEFTDSMIWDAWTGLSRLLVPKFAGQSRAVLELKTKTTAIPALKGLPHNRKTIMAWSLNTPRVIKNEERNTASLSARLNAAATCASWGYPLAFHFDPMIIYDGCEADYRQVVKSLFARVAPEDIVWISLGTFRFSPELKPIVQSRFPSSKIIYGESIPGLDGKMRYFKPLRVDLYQKMVGWIKEAAPEVLVYFCMEDDEVWEKTMGFAPSERGGLARMLDDSAAYHCGLIK